MAIAWTEIGDENAVAKMLDKDGETEFSARVWCNPIGFYQFQIDKRGQKQPVHSGSNFSGGFEGTKAGTAIMLNAYAQA